jgi:tRNA(Ile2) C34 agmatinyltransferase TiaS
MKKKMRAGFVNKRCPKCGGNVYIDKDFYGWYEKCLQCGYASDLQSLVEVREKVGKGSPDQAGGRRLKQPAFETRK